MKNVILSKDTYSWIRYTSGLILQNPNDYAVFILFKDNRLIDGNKNFCEDAVYIQRKHDLATIGEKLCLKKLYNFNCIEVNDLDFKRVVVQLSLYFALSGTKRVYCPDDNMLRRVIRSINKNIEIWTYNRKIEREDFERIELSSDLLKRKICLSKYIIGNGSVMDLDINKKIETFYKEI